MNKREKWREDEKRVRQKKRKEEGEGKKKGIGGESRGKWGRMNKSRGGE